MAIALISILIIGVVGLIATIGFAGKSDEDYTSSTKQNLSRLTWIYVALGAVLLGGVAYFLI